MSNGIVSAIPVEMAPSVSAQELLRVDDIEVIYDGAILAVSGVSLVVRQGGITALLGANGAGKSTTLKAISGLLAPTAPASAAAASVSSTNRPKESRPSSWCAPALCMCWKAAKSSRT